MRASFHTDQGVVDLQRSLHPEFLTTFRKGLNLYIAGQWQEAVAAIHRANDLRPGDGPCKTLLRVMAASDNVAPDDWEGVRALTEK